MELTRLPNIGPELARLLNEVEIRDSEELKELGAEMACLRMKAKGLDVCFHKLTALEGAVGDKKIPAHPEAQSGAAGLFRRSAEGMMNITEVTGDKKRYLALLLLADEQESMIDRYLNRGTMFVLMDGGVRGECVVTDEGSGILELKNLAVEPAFQNMGYGRALIEYVAARYRGQYSILQVGTGDSPLTVPFYEKCGFVRSHKIENFFTERYDHPIYEGGVQLTDMVYLRREL